MARRAPVLQQESWNTRLGFCVFPGMAKFLLWCILFVLCWPIAIAALIVYPVIWVCLLPFRIVGIAVGGALTMVWTIVTLPMLLLRRPRFL